MNLVLLSAAPEVAPPNPWPGIQISWTSPDGSRTWLLTDEYSPVRLLAGARGLTMPDGERQRDEPPGVPGSRYRGRRDNEREVFWPLMIYGGSSTQEHLDIDAEFWDSMHPEEQGTWRVSTPDRGSRELRLRFDREDTAWEMAPGLTDWSLYEVYLVAEDPYWRSTPVVREFVGAGQAARFADPATPALWHISPRSTQATATITNPGDVDTCPWWWLHGPFNSGYAGVGNRRVVVPFPVAAGKSLIVDTDPQDRRALLIDTPPLEPGSSIADQIAAIELAMATGVDRTSDLGSETAFAPVPRGTQRPIALSMTGSVTGSAQVVLRPQHYRAWGRA